MKPEKSSSPPGQAEQFPTGKVRQESFQESATFRTKRYNNLRKFILVVFVALIVSLPINLAIGLSVSANILLMTIPSVIWLFSYGFAFFYARADSQKRLDRACYVMLGGIIIAMPIFHYLVGSVSMIMVAYTCVILIGPILGLRLKAVLTLSALSILTAGGMVAAQVGFKLFTPPVNLADQPLIEVIVVVFALTVFTAEVIILVHNLYAAMNEAQEQAHQYHQVNQHLSRTNHFGRQVTNSLSTIVTELNSTSRQQASGAQEQAAAVMEVTTSMTELGETARQIAMNTKQVSVAASDGFYSAERVREATQRANTTAERGQTAVDSAIKAIEEVRNGISGLAERLMTLTERSRQISSIIALIKEIADETHLLALNAAIESAGSGENGRRFAVVASEVKSLADRSLEATSEVGQIIGELQGAVAAAVLASEETRKKTFGAVERSYMAGQVITELGQVVDETTTSSVQIVDSVQQVATLAEEIRLATQQQESAIRQIINTMENVGMVAQENASAVGEVSETVNRIDNLSNQLKEALDNAGMILNAA